MKLNESIKRSMKQKLLKEAGEITIEDVKRWLTTIGNTTQTFGFSVIKSEDADKLAEEFMKTGHVLLAEGDAVAAHLVNSLKAIDTGFAETGPMIVFTTNDGRFQQSEQALAGSDEGKDAIELCVNNFETALRILNKVELSISELAASAAQ